MTVSWRLLRTIVGVSVSVMMLMTLLPGPVVGTENPSASSSVFNAAQIRHAYQEGNLFYVGVRGQGSTVTIVNQYDPRLPPTGLQADFHTFSIDNGLRTGGLSISVVGNVSGLPDPYWSWGLESDLDVQAVHAVAPRSSIHLILAPTWPQVLNATAAALNATPGGIFSLSWGDADGLQAIEDGNDYRLNSSLRAAALNGTNVFAASGDCGAYPNTTYKDTYYPASSPWAIGVGGTDLVTSSTGAWKAEFGWNGTGGTSCGNAGGSGGGIGPLGNEVPVVSALGGGFLSIVVAGRHYPVGGTSLAAPLWAGFAAVLRTAIHRDLGWLVPQFASIYANATAYRFAFHDITAGFNGYNCTVARDLVTGYGTPDLAGLVKVVRSG